MKRKDLALFSWKQNAEWISLIQTLKKLVRHSHIIVMDVQQMQPAQLLNQRTNFTAREIKKPEACRHIVALDTNPAQTLNQNTSQNTREIKKDDSVDRHCRLMDTEELAPWNHLLRTSNTIFVVLSTNT